MPLEAPVAVSSLLEFKEVRCFTPLLVWLVSPEDTPGVWQV